MGEHSLDFPPTVPDNLHVAGVRLVDGPRGGH